MRGGPEWSKRKPGHAEPPKAVRVPPAVRSATQQINHYLDHQLTNLQNYNRPAEPVNTNVSSRPSTISYCPKWDLNPRRVLTQPSMRQAVAWSIRRLALQAGCFKWLEMALHDAGLQRVLGS